MLMALSSGFYQLFIVTGTMLSFWYVPKMLMRTFGACKTNADVLGSILECGMLVARQDTRSLSRCRLFRLCERCTSLYVKAIDCCSCPADLEASHKCPGPVHDALSREVSP